MATKQKFSNETLFVETTVVENSVNPPTSGAVYTALGGVTAEIPTEATIKAYIYDTIYMSANDKVYEVTIDDKGALAVAEQEAVSTA